jgi:hypothetical protein
MGFNSAFKGLIKISVNALNEEGERFEYLRQKFPSISENQDK